MPPRVQCRFRAPAGGLQLFDQRTKRWSCTALLLRQLTLLVHNRRSSRDAARDPSRVAGGRRNRCRCPATRRGSGAADPA